MQMAGVLIAYLFACLVETELSLIVTSSFIAYIDESGDEGFKYFADRPGSTHWFVLSAAVFRASNSNAPTEILKRSRLVLGKAPKVPLHFRELKHEMKTAYIHEITKEKMRTVSVLVHKPSINEPERYASGKYLLYKYVTRLLLERVSWLCRDTRTADDGDGMVDLIFSDRTAMSYESLREYLQLLQRQSMTSDSVRVDWTSISPDRVQAVRHQKLAGLQVADAVASSTFFAAEVNRFGQTEPRYLRMLTPQIYSHDKVKNGYGLKFWPDAKVLTKKMPHLAALF